MKHLLVARFSAFGDVAMTVPVVRCFLQQNPDVCITFVSQSYLAPLFEGIERLTFVPANLKDKHKGVLGLQRLWKEIMVVSDGKIDYFIDLHSSIRTFILRIFARLSFIPVCYMRKGRKARRKLTKGGINKHPLRTIPERYADVFRQCGFNVSLEKKSGIKQFPLFPSITEKTGFNPSLPSVGIAPFSQYTGKTYPLDEMYKVVESLAEKKDIQVVLVGGRGEEASILDKWAAPYPNVINAAGKISLSEELSLISQLNVMVSMDSANMHLCSMVGTRVISIWGATHHFAGFLGFGQSIEDIIEIDDMPCRPCHAFGKKPCRYGTYECMKSIKPHDITYRIMAAL